MTDVLTKKPIRVWAEESEWPWIGLPVSQLDEVRKLLDSHGLRYRVSEHYVSFNEEPFTTILTFERGTDGRSAQAILDSVS